MEATYGTPYALCPNTEEKRSQHYSLFLLNLCSIFWGFTVNPNTPGIKPLPKPRNPLKL